MKTFFCISFLSFFLITGLWAQPASCYVRLEDASGYTPTSEQLAELEAAACALIDSFPAAFRDSFRVYDFGFYLHHEVTEGGYPEPFAQKIQEVQALTPYYLLFGKQTDKSGVYTRFWVDVKLPADSVCLTAAKLKSFRLIIENKTNNAYKDPFNYDFAEIVGMSKLNQIIVGSRIGNCCPIDPLEIFELLSQKGFVGIPIEIQVSNTRPDSINRKKLTNYLNDYAQLAFILEGQLINFTEEIFAEQYGALASQNIDAKCYVTKNENFCSESPIINIVENEFKDENLEMATWYHIWNSPLSEGFDILFTLRRIKKNSYSSFGTLPQQGEMTPPSPYQFTIRHRAFAPWRKFGHFFFPPVPCVPIFHTNKNSF